MSREVVMELTEETRKKFYAREKFFSSKEQKEIPNYIWDSAEEAIKEFSGEISKTVQTLMDSTEFLPEQVFEDDTVDISGIKSWEDFMLTVGSYILYKELTQTDQDIDEIDSKRRDLDPIKLDNS